MPGLRGSGQVQSGNFVHERVKGAHGVLIEEQAAVRTIRDDAWCSLRLGSFILGQSRNEHLDCAVVSYQRLP